jgi:hypothetical protein
MITMGFTGQEPVDIRNLDFIQLDGALPESSVQEPVDEKQALLRPGEPDPSFLNHMLGESPLDLFNGGRCGGGWCRRMALGLQEGQQPSKIAGCAVALHPALISSMGQETLDASLV